MRGSVRHPSGVLPEGTVARTVPEFLDEAALQRAMDGAQGVIHLAARVHVIDERVSDPLVAYRRANVEVTRSLIEVAMAIGVRRFVFVS